MRRSLLPVLVVLCAALLGVRGAAEEPAFCRLVGPLHGAVVEVSLDDARFPVRLIGVAPGEEEENEGRERISTFAGRQVWLEYDRILRDGDGPLLAYVWLGQPRDDSLDEARAKMLNGLLIAEGLAVAALSGENRRHERLLAACQAEARAARRGLWGRLPAAAAAEEEVVWITASGRCYHRAGCHTLGKSKEPLPLSTAKARGYTPCRLCKPPS
ncbi:MAG: thermonuclease family protein [Bacteroidota bacterium]